MTLLTFCEGKFVLQKNGSVATTSDISKAVRFRKYADGKAEFMFQRFMLKTSPLPAGGLIHPPEISLYDFQSEKGIPHTLSLNKSYKAHQPGLGKTGQAVVAVNSKPGKTLIICPGFLKITWAREITKWSHPNFPDIAIVKESSKQEQTNWSADFIIVSDAMLIKSWVRKGIYSHKFKYVFIDEVHRYSDPKALRTVALFGGRRNWGTKRGLDKFSSKGLIYRSEHVCAMSGTPQLGKPIQLWPLLYAMAPEIIDFMSYDKFGLAFCGPTRNQFGGWDFLRSSNEADLKKRLTTKFMQRIRRKDVLKELPEKIREIIIIDEENRKPDVIQFDKELQKKIDEEKLGKLYNMGAYAKLRHQTGLAKVPWVSNYVNEIMTYDETESILLFGHHRDVLEGFHKKLSKFKPAIIYGGMTEREKTRIQDAFQAREIRLIIGNISAMNLGLTLTEATRALFPEWDWNPTENEQAEDRANRIGSKWSLLCQYFAWPNSLDYNILNSNLIKEERSLKVIG